MAPPLKVPTAVAAIAIPAICLFEGLYTYAYRDPVGIPTICFGHIEDVKMGDRRTPEECKQMLLDDLPRYYAGVKRCIKVPMSGSREAAMLSFTYNVGEGALCKSSVARKLNAGDVAGGCGALLLYTYAKGIQLPGLVNRRRSEYKLCMKDDDPIVVAKPDAPKPVPAPIPPEEKAEKRLTIIERIWNWIKGWFK